VKPGDMKLPVISLDAQGDILIAGRSRGAAWIQGNNGSLAAAAPTSGTPRFEIVER